MENPFVYGGVVTGKNFVDRERELVELRRDLLSGKSVVLYSPRQIGKSSLVEEMFSRLEKDVYHARVDVSAVDSRHALAKQIVEAIIDSAYTKLDKMRKAVSELPDLLRGLRVNVVVTPEREIKFEFARDAIDKELGEIFDLAEKIARQKGKRMLLAFDEFQDISDLDGVTIEKLMRSKFQYHKNVTYLFMGSKRHMLMRMFNDRSRPFYKFSKPMELGPIPRPEFKEFISEKFEKSGGEISDEAVDAILNLTGGHPYYTQQLCYVLWFISKKVVDKSLVLEAVNEILVHEKKNYLELMGRLTPLQRRFLRGLATEDDVSVFSSNFVEKYELKTHSHVQRLVKSLEGKGMLDEGKITDTFFKEWLRRLSGSPIGGS
jgi:hypothetical protein